MLAEEHETTHERLMMEKNDIETERRANADLLDELSRELEELRLFKAQHDAKRLAADGGAGSGEMSRSQRKQFETHIRNLRQVND